MIYYSFIGNKEMRFIEEKKIELFSISFFLLQFHFHIGDYDFLKGRVDTMR